MRSVFKTGAVLAAGLAFVSAPASADSSGLRFSGFGTLALTHMSSDQADFKGAFSDVPNGAGRSDSTSAKPDSRLALQLDAGLTDKIDVVGQIMTRQNRFNNYEPSIEMLNLKYSFSRSTSVRVGRIAHPFFLASDTRLIGYANTFARGPSEVYNQSQIYNSDVVQVSHRMPLAGGNAVMTAGVGRSLYGNPSSNASLGDEDKGKYRKLMFADINWERGALLLRLSHHTGRNSFDSNGARALYANAARVNAALAEELGLMDKKVSFTGLAAVYDPGEFVVQAEYTLTRWGSGAKSIAPDADAYYVMGGWRTGAFTPYAIYAKRKTSTPRVVTEFAVPQLNAAFTGFAANSANAQHTVTAGLRWDVRPNVALKLQFDRMTVDAKSGVSFLTNLNPAKRPKQGDSFNVVGLNLDFVF